MKQHSQLNRLNTVWFSFKTLIILNIAHLQDQVPSITPNEVIGVVRGSEKPSIFVPANDPESSQWFYIDVPSIARHCGLPENTIYVEDVNENVNPSNPYPVPKDVNTLIRSSVMPQDHLNYILTWCATAFLSLHVEYYALFFPSNYYLFSIQV
jgi:cytochrome oxidase assembly protein ShyY1